MIWSDTITFQPLVNDYFETFTLKTVADAQKTRKVLIPVTRDSRREADVIAEAASAAGGKADVRAHAHGIAVTTAPSRIPDRCVFEPAWMDARGRLPRWRTAARMPDSYAGA
jgi:predicted lactoylglutathione lyase